MAGQSKVGGIAAMVTVVGYVASAGVLLWGTAIADGNGGGNDLAIVVVTWWVGGTIGTIAAAVAVYAALRRSGGFGSGLAKAAIVVAVLAALTSTLLWAFFIWGLLLSLAMLLLALHLRKSGLGVVGTASRWDWVIPAAFPLGVATTLGLYATVVEQTDDLEWGYTCGFAIGTLLTAVAMVQFGRWLRSTVEVVEVAATA